MGKNEKRRVESVLFSASEPVRIKRFYFQLASLLELKILENLRVFP